MNKILALIFAMALMLSTVSFVAAVDVDVDCTQGQWWNSDICRDNELQDEFDEVTDAINENTQGIEQNEQDIDNLENVVGGAVSDVANTNSYITSKEYSWAKDEVGGGGISEKSVMEILTGNRKYLDAVDREWNFLTFLKSIFAPKEDIEALHLRLDKIEAYARLPHNATAIQVDLMTAMITSQRTGGRVESHGYTCTNGFCVKLIPVNSSKKTTGTGGAFVVNNQEEEEWVTN